MNADEQTSTVNGAAFDGKRSDADYDQLPYPSLPVDYSQPSQMAAMATLFGLTPPRIADGRTLELGCASGGNIIPLAARFPAASFLGIDLSQRHVEDGRRRVAQLGLTNVEIRHGDLTQASFRRETFDFIVCHGVFSWVPKVVQDAIFRICSESLAADGIAAISYNVLPGWHMRRIVRDICLFHADKNDTPSDRVAKARAAVNDIAQSSNDATPYAMQLRQEADRLAKAPSAYILGEFLAEYNAPCYFSEFAARAGASGLSFVCEGDVATSLPEYFLPAASEQIRAKARGNAGALQQYTDFFSGRQFRRSVMVRSARASGISAAIDPARLRGLHFAADLKLNLERSKPGAPVFVDSKGREAAPNDPVIERMLARLVLAYPSTLTFDELLGGSIGNAAHEERALNTLLTLLGYEQATVSALPLKVGAEDSERPCAWLPARLDAAAKQPWAASQHHKAVKLSPPIGFLLPLLDGSRDRAALRQALRDVMARGEVQGESPDPDDVLTATLAYAARQGLLLA